MKLKFILLFSAAIVMNNAQAQEMTGFRTDNYNGVNGAFFNPANLGNSPFKIDVNIIGMDIFAGNKNINFANAFSDANGDNGTLNKLIGEKSNDIKMNLSLHLPSVSYSLNENTTIAFISRSRLLFDVNEFDGKLINSINNETAGLGFPYKINNSTNMRMSANLFSEFGLSAGHVLYNNSNHFIKVGATLKYLAGVSNTYFQLDKLNTTIDTSGTKVYATNSTGSIAVGAGGADFDNEINFGFNASGFGADLGAVYEYRPDYLQEENNKYLFKISVAILDLGSIKYKALPQYSAGYDINIPAGQQFDLDAFSGASITETKAVFDAHPQYFTRTAGLNNGSYRVALPHTLQLGGDFQINLKFYVAANVQLAMTNNTDKPFNPKSLNSLVLTPRFETRIFAAYLPISYNNLSKMNLGIGLRAGPFYAGSSSAVSAIAGQQKQMDFYFGFRVGIKGKSKENKI